MKTLIAVAALALIASTATAEVLVLDHTAIMAGQARATEYRSCKERIKAAAVAAQKKTGLVESQATVAERIQFVCGITRLECEDMIIDRLNQVSRARPVTEEFIASQTAVCANNPDV